MKNIILAFSMLFSAQFVQAETVTFSATDCVTKYNSSEFDYSRGVIENRGEAYNLVTCNIDTEQGRDIEKVEVSYFIMDVKPRQSSSCHVTFYESHATSFNASATTENAGDGNNIVSAGPFYIAQTPSRGVLRCNLPGVEAGGLARIHSYSVTYL